MHTRNAQEKGWEVWGVWGVEGWGKGVGGTGQVVRKTTVSCNARTCQRAGPEHAADAACCLRLRSAASCSGAGAGSGAAAAGQAGHQLLHKAGDGAEGGHQLLQQLSEQAGRLGLLNRRGLRSDNGNRQLLPLLSLLLRLQAGGSLREQ